MSDGGTLAEGLAEIRARANGRMGAAGAAAAERMRAHLLTLGIPERAPGVGERVPDFALPNVHGKRVALADLRERGPVVIAFYRGGWCPYCNLQLRSYQQILPEIQSAGASLVAISPEAPDNALGTSEKNELRFEVLSDRHHEVARSYGLLFDLLPDLIENYQSRGRILPEMNDTDSWALPVPGTFVVDRTGTVRLRYVEPDYTLRLEPAAILQALDGLS